MVEDLKKLWDKAELVNEPEDLQALWDAAEGKSFGRGDLTLAASFEEQEEAFKAPLIDIDIEPQTIGGIAGGVAGIPYGRGGMIGGAALGGMAGKAYEQTYNYFVEPEEAPETFTEATKEILKAGGEEAVYEVGGQAIGYVIGKGYHVLRPKIHGGIESLQKTLEKYGGSFTAAERTESFLTETVDSLVRGSLSGKGIMKNADDINDAALKLWQEDLSNQIAKSATKNMTDGDFGSLIKTTLSNGKAGFKTSTNELYSSFDDLVVTKIEKEMVEKKVATNLLDAQGQPITKKVISEITKEIRPVDMRPLKDEALKLSQKLARIAGFGKSEFGGKAIDDVLSLDDALRFSDAQNLRSTMLDITRGLKNKPEEAKLVGSITRFAKHVTEAMDNAAKSQGDDIFNAYKKIKDVTEKGFKSFNDKLIVSILNDDTSSVKVGEMIFREGNVDQIHALKKALHRAARYDKSIHPGEIWEQTQQKYLEAYLHGITKDIEMTVGESLVEFQAKAGVADAAKLGRKLQTAKAMNTMDAMLDKPHRELIMQFAQAAGITQAKNVAGLGMLIQLTQAGALVGAVSGRPGAARMAASVTIPTAVLARMMTNPTTVKLITSAAKTPTSAKQAPTIITKLMIAYENAKKKEAGEKTPAEEAIEFTEKQFKAL